jgi:NHL repeat
MIANRIKTLPLAVVTAVILMLAGAGGAQALPTKFLFSGQIGWNVDKTKTNQAGATQQEKNLCTVASKDECQFGEENTGSGGFKYPFSVAVAANGNVYVADTNNKRIQELTASGKFILMFGWNVNATKVKAGGATQAEENVCTAVSKDECQEGEEGTGLAGQLSGAYSLAVDQTSGNVFVMNLFNWRVDEYTPEGEFVLMIGGEVNQTKDTTPGASEAEKNLCTAASSDVCKAGRQSSAGSTAHGAFKFAQSHGSVLAVGPKDHLLYVGDEARVQKFTALGEWAGPQISLSGLSPTGHVQGVAVDSAGNVFVADQEVAGVHEYDAGGILRPCVIDPASVSVEALALDAYGRLGIIELEVLGKGNAKTFGVLYGTQGGECGVRLATFAGPSGEMPGFPDGIAFDTSKPSEPLSDRLYVAAKSAQEVDAYVPVVFPNVETCVPPAKEVMATSATLCGKINPEGLLTRGFFQYGTSVSLGSESPVVFEGKGTTFEPVYWQLSGLIPNETYYFRIVAEAEVEEKLAQQASVPVAFHTATSPPEVPGAPTAWFVTSQSAVLGASLNPEHATTRYHFEYAPCENESQTLAECGEVKQTVDLESAQYGLIGARQEASGLASLTTYAFRLVANNKHEEPGGEIQGGRTPGEEGHFETGRLPIPQAQTGAHNLIAATSATVSGSVDPDGQPATYAFELGVYAGAATSYGIVFSGPAGAGTMFTEETLALSGLQPGTTYAYRIKISSGYGTAWGEPATFTTEGLAEALQPSIVLEQLAIPNIAFPKEAAKVTPKKLTRAQKLANALKACTKKVRHVNRKKCEKEARVKYGPRGKKAVRKK